MASWETHQGKEATRHKGDGGAVGENERTASPFLSSV